MSKISGLLLLLVLLPGPACVCAVQTDRDLRVQMRVRLNLVQVPLSDLCWVVEKRTGIPHRAADPATGDLLTSVVGELTVEELQQALADVLGVSWKRVGSGQQSSYRVERTPARIAEEVRLVEQMDQAFREDLTQLVQAANLPDEAFARLPRDLRSRIPDRDAARVLGHLLPEDQGRVLAGFAVNRPFASFSPDGQACIRAMVEASNRNLSRMRAGPNAALFQDVRPVDPQNSSSWSLRIGPDQQQRVPGLLTLLVSVSSPEQPGVGSAVNVRIPLPGTGDGVGYRLASAGTSTQPPGLPALAPEQVPSSKIWTEVMGDLARMLDLPILSDAYLPTELLLLPSPSTKKNENLAAYLDRACRGYWHRRWGRAERVLTFQRVDWPLQRSRQIPESRRRRWSEHLRATGHFVLDDLLEMASLTPRQLANLSLVMGGQSNLVTENRDLLLFWKAVPEAQRRKMLTDGLFLRDLPLSLQASARALVVAALKSDAALMLANARLRAEQAEETFTVSVHAPNQRPAVRRLDLKCPPAWLQHLQKEAEARVAALRSAAGVAAVKTGLDDPM